MGATLRGWYLRWSRYGRETPRLVAEAQERERWSPVQWDAWRQERLGYVLHRAATRVPYYRALWEERRRRGDRASWELLENWPILDNDRVRENPHAFIADDQNPHWMFTEHTSGTTGRPLVLWRTHRTMRELYALSLARTRLWHGVSRTDRWAMLGGQLVVPAANRQPPFWVWNAALRQLYMSTYHLAPDLIPAYLDALQHHQVAYLAGYSSSLYALAQDVLRLGRSDVTMRVALTSAEPLTGWQRETISAAFRCPVRETYGMSEAVAWASECEAGTLHQWPEVGLIEVLANGVAAAPGELGEFICTGLLNPDFPLIRYRLGDSGQVAPPGARCGCGRSLPALSAVEGRTNDLLVTRDGRRVAWLNPVWYGMPVRQGQIVQETVDRVRVRYVPAAGFNANSEKVIAQRFHERLGPVQVVFEEVPEIPRGANGKFRSVLSALPRGERASAPSAAGGATTAPIRVLMVTSHWPTPGQPRTTYFIKRQAEFLQAAGVEVDVFHFRGRRNPWNYLSAWWRLRRRLAGAQYDAVHAQFGHSGMLAFPKRLPLVVTYRGSDLLGEVGRGARYTRFGHLLQLVSRAVARRADAVIVVSEHMKAELPPGVPAHVIPSGLDFQLFRPIPRDEARRHLGLPLDRRLVLFVGSPDWPRKRYTLARAAVDCLDRTLPAELVVAWGVPHDDVPYFMNACDALIFTSMQEGSPNVVKEALACDLPVVSVPVGDVPLRLANVAGCELCADEQPETIAAALERVLRRGGRAGGGRAAVQELDERLLTDRVIAIYRSLMRPRSVSSAPALAASGGSC